MAAAVVVSQGEPLCCVAAVTSAVTTSRPSLGYEPTDVRLRCLGQSLVTVLTSTDLLGEVLRRLLCLPRLSLSRREPVYKSVYRSGS